MGIPTTGTRENALLCLLYLAPGSMLKSVDTYAPLADLFKLTPTQRNERLADGTNRNYFENLMQNSRQKLKQQGLIGGKIRGYWDLTPKGIDRAKGLSSLYSQLPAIARTNGVKIEIESFSIERFSLDEQDVLYFPEGKKILALHIKRERNPKLSIAAKESAYEKDPWLHCQICHLSFIKTYGEIGRNFIEAHHTTPLSELSGETNTRLKDIALVCSNCHRMIHRYRPWLTIDELNSLLDKNLSKT